MKRFHINWRVRLLLFGVFCVLCIISLVAPQGVSQGAISTTATPASSASASLPGNTTAGYGYGGGYSAQIPLACDTPAGIAKRDFGWNASLLTAKYQKASQPRLCDDKWPWTTTTCLPTSTILATLGWPADLLQPQYRNQVTCARGKSPTTGTTSPPPVTTSVTTQNDCILNDILPWTPPGFSLCDALQKIFNSYVLQPIQSSVQSFAQQANGFLWTTPAIYDGTTNNNITDIWKIVLWIVDGLVALAVITNGIKLVAQQQSLASALNYANVLDAVPRVLFALLAAHFSLSFFQILVTGNNALANIFAGDHQLIGLIDSKTASSFLQFLELFWGIMALLLIIQSIIRIGGLYILLVTAPAWLFAWGVAETQPLARAATTAAIGITFMQALQLLILDVGGHLVATLVLGTSPQYQVINVLSGIAVLYIALKVPGWISRWAFQSSTDVSSALKNAAAWAVSMIGA